jgi:hypothetical protein
MKFCASGFTGGIVLKNQNYKTAVSRTVIKIF